MSNTINIVQPKAEDGTPVSYVTRTNSIYKSDGSPLGDSMDAYMDEVDELNQNLTELQGVNCYRKFFIIGGGAYSITNVEAGDLIFFIRNGLGLVAIADNNTVLELITLQSITGVSYNSNIKTISFTRSSSYTGGVLVLSKNGNVALAS